MKTEDDLASGADYSILDLPLENDLAHPELKRATFARLAS